LRSNNYDWTDKIIIDLYYPIKYNVIGDFMPEMTAQEAIEWGKTLNLETVWATITK
jgi:hypothetical protein